MTRVTKLFVSGPMTGLPGYNLPRFREATVELESVGFEVVNPGRRGVIDGYEWSDYMRSAIRDLVDCDGVALLDGWQRSCGSQMEVGIADQLGMPAYAVERWIVRGKR